jgi:Ca2+/Na+ antiporter
MNEIILLLVAVLMMFIIPITISNLKTPLQSYVKITSAVLFISFVFVISSSDNRIWPILIIFAILLTSLAREFMNIYSFKRQNKIN